MPLEQLYGMEQMQALVVSMKGIYGWLLMLAIAALGVTTLGYFTDLRVFVKRARLRNFAN